MRTNSLANDQLGFIMKFIYSSGALWTIFSAITTLPRLQPTPWNVLKAAGIARKVTKRGSRGGINLQRKITVVHGNGKYNYFGSYNNSIFFGRNESFIQNDNMQISTKILNSNTGNNASLAVHSLGNGWMNTDTTAVSGVNYNNLTYIRCNNDRLTSNKQCSFCLLNCRSFSLRQHVRDPKHRSGHTLDLKVTREDENIIGPVSVTESVISDHNLVNSSLNLLKPTLMKRCISSRKIKSVDIERLKSDICDALGPSTDISTNVNDLVFRYYTELTRIIDIHAPLKKRHVVIRPAAPWYNDDIKDAKRVRCLRDDGVEHVTLLIIADHCCILNL